ncbi:hypothetical protein J2X24_001552 [Asticcacaulis solisilvae]|nr:hypothetical protein [Asticcacaulis solisilvae]MDR6800034.1 hypothetical protein [Asticcacaulis sp. BE141]
MKLQARARGLFTHLAKSGEGGELLLFAMAEAVFGLAQILCKMTLKTSPHVHYHGADGVYADVRTDGGLNVYWAESKIFGDPVAAIRECLNSLAPFLVEPDGTHAKREQDILLINEFANFSNADLVIGLKQFFDRDTPASLQLQHRGFALVGFDSLAYGTDGVEQTMDAIEAALKIELPSWQNNIATDPAP